MESILTDLQASIEKNLPAQVGEVLKKQLEKGTQDAATVKRQQVEIETLKKQLADTQSQIQSQWSLTRREEDLMAKVIDLEERERNMKVTLLETQLAEANKRADVVTDLTRTVFKNPTYVTKEYNSQSTTTPGYTDGTTGRWVNGTSENKSTHTDKTTEIH